MDKREEFIYELNNYPKLNNKIRWNPRNNAFIGHFRFGPDVPVFMIITYKVYKGMMFCQFAYELIDNTLDEDDLYELSTDIRESGVFSELGFPNVFLTADYTFRDSQRTLILQIETEFDDSYVSAQNAIKAMHTIVKTVVGPLWSKLDRIYGSNLCLLGARPNEEDSLINIW